MTCMIIWMTIFFLINGIKFIYKKGNYENCVITCNMHVSFSCILWVMAIKGIINWVTMCIFNFNKFYTSYVKHIISYWNCFKYNKSKDWNKKYTIKLLLILIRFYLVKCFFSLKIFLLLIFFKRMLSTQISYCTYSL